MFLPKSARFWLILGHFWCFLAQTQQSKFVNWQMDAEYRGADFTAALTLGNPDVLMGSGELGRGKKPQNCPNLPKICIFHPKISTLNWSPEWEEQNETQKLGKFPFLTPKLVDFGVFDLKMEDFRIAQICPKFAFFTPKFDLKSEPRMGGAK